MIIKNRSKFGTSVAAWAVGAVIVTLIALRLIALHIAADNPSEGVSGPKEDAVLFKELVDAGLIRPANSSESKEARPTHMLEVAPEDTMYFIKAELKSANDSALEKSLERQASLIDRLYKKEVGRTVLKAVQLWNEAHYFTAIRDARPDPAGAKPNQWAATDATYTHLPLKEIRQVPHFCAFVTDGVMKPGFGDWLRAYTSDGDVAYKTRVSLSDRTTITIQLVGHLVSAHPEPDTETFIDIPKDRSFNGMVASTSSPGASLCYTLPAGEHELRIVARPVEFQQSFVPGLNIAWENGKQWPESIKWNDLPPTHRRSQTAFSLSTADNTILFYEDGHPTQDAWDLGLVPMTGMNAGDRNTLAWIFSTALGSKDLKLTLDASLQKSALRHLEGGINALWKRDRYAKQRRGAVVMLDADTGEILAAASYPRFKKGFHPWDVEAFSTFYPLQNVRTFWPWQGVDGHNAPGSTFKPVVAMAAIKAMRSGISNADEIIHFLEGYPLSQIHKTGLARNCAAYDPVNGICYHSRNIPANKTAIPNFGRRSLASACKGDHTMGLKQAIRESINVWFVRLGCLMDGDAAREYDAAIEGLQKGQKMPGWPPFHLGRLAKMVGFNEQPLDLLMNVNNELSRTEPRNNTEGDILFGATGKLNLLNQEQMGLQRILAQNTIGQGVTATPLQMARVAATIATGKIPYPYLAGELDGRRLDAPARERADLDERGMDLLRSGMKAVTETGTASRAFKEHTDRKYIYGKTGTANVANGNKAFWSTWFVGWWEPQKRGDRRIAFACLVTHATGRRSRTGGRVAAPIIANIFKDLGHEKTVPVNQQANAER